MVTKLRFWLFIWTNVNSNKDEAAEEFDEMSIRRQFLKHIHISLWNLYLHITMSWGSLVKIYYGFFSFVFCVFVCLRIATGWVLFVFNTRALIGSNRKHWALRWLSVNARNNRWEGNYHNLNPANMLPFLSPPDMPTKSRLSPLQVKGLEVETKLLLYSSSPLFFLI